MKKLQTIQLIIYLLLLQSVTVVAQEAKPFWNEIQTFQKEDSIQQPPTNSILFVGSSSFRLWKGIEQAFPEHTIINRGFGGSSLPHVIQYADAIIFPYQPRQIVIYCGENDLASSETVTSELVIKRFKELFAIIRNRLPNVSLAYVSMKPSPSRWHLKEKMQDANNGIRAFLKMHKNTVFIDVWKPMLGKDGKPREELFVDDKLHMNEKGYAVWERLIKSHLVKT